MSDLRVLHIVQTPLDFVGGPATYVRELSKHLSMRAVKTEIISPKPMKFNDEIKSLSNDYGVELHYVDFSIFAPLLRVPWFFSAKAHKLISRIVKDYDVVNIHVESTFLQLLMNTFNSLKVISTIHGIYPYEDVEVLKHEPLNFYRLFRLMFVSPQHYITIREHITKGGIVIAVAGFLAEIIRHMFKVSEEKICVIPNSVDTDLFKNIREDLALAVVNEVLTKKGFNRTLDDKDNVILFVSRLDPCKGLHLLLRGLAKMQSKSWMLLVVGIGSHSYERYLKDLSFKLGLIEKVLLTGNVPYSKLPYFYSIAQVYVLPSMFEGLPATILEAMACGTPVIATKVGGIPEVISNGYNGLLLDSLSEDEISRAVEQLLMDSSFRKRLSQRALRTIQEKFSWKISVEKYIKLLSRLI
jgi:glycosyltransferase involved in cell wall biosynthesis